MSMVTRNVFRRVLKLARSWPTLVGDFDSPLSDKTQEEVEYIKGEAALFRLEANRKMTDPEEIQAQLRSAMDRMDIAEHYKIPYPKAHHNATGSVDARVENSAKDAFNQQDLL
uniref:Uncharacterized protein n=1 Tax=Hemiselmis andersenii TaxID=464988 RepID=A0A6U2I0Q7_HEMAN|mmetsp:Transcript_42804/g.99398  ORF Transcript_42804/g.99398 Transcript_42804/m.99398 type:complete len:113 (-) Transcript_42804:149-487(-)